MSVNCDPKIFIENLYKMLSLGNYCFLSGTFIIEDNDMYLYNYLRNGYIFENEHSKCNNTKENIQCFISFTDVLKKLDTKLNKGFKLTGKVHEKKVNKYKLTCENKSIEINAIIYYPFKIKTENKENIYLYFRLRQTECFGLFQYKKKISNNLNIRKEKKYDDIINKNNNIYTDILKKIPNTDIKTIEKVNESIYFYNNNVRVGSEFFIPYYLTLNILKNIFEI